jgi:hypothetical protein
MNSRRDFLKKAGLSAILFTQPGLFACTTKKTAEQEDAPFIKTRGVIVAWEDLTLDWAGMAHAAGLTTIGITVPEGVKSSETWQQFLKDCRKYNLEIEHDQHAMGQLLPRSLFEKNPEMFRMNEKGERVPDYNCCAHSEPALAIIRENVVKDMELNKSTSGRYFFWLDDGGERCFCPLCKDYSDSDQALIIENEIVKVLKKEDKRNTLAHLAYQRTIKAPEKVKPEEGVFLQFAPFQRTWNFPITHPTAKREDVPIKNADYITHLEENLKVFPVATAEVLEYWLDDSLFSDWKKPAVKLPWNKDIFQQDVAAYAKLGIQHIVSFAVYIDQEYVNKYKDLTFINEYGNFLKQYKP